jgi:hypothetical protein
MSLTDTSASATGTDARNATPTPPTALSPPVALDAAPHVRLVDAVATVYVGDGAAATVLYAATPMPPTSVYAGVPYTLATRVEVCDTEMVAKRGGACVWLATPTAPTATSVCATLVGATFKVERLTATAALSTGDVVEHATPTLTTTAPVAVAVRNADEVTEPAVAVTPSTVMLTGPTALPEYAATPMEPTSA